MKTKKEPIVWYAVESAKAINRMLKEIDRCNNLHRKKTNAAINRFTRDIEIVRAKRFGFNNVSLVAPAAKKFCGVSTSLK